MLFDDDIPYKVLYFSMVGLFDKCDDVNVSYCKYKIENT